jgi:hypothetical protein
LLNLRLTLAESNLFANLADGGLLPQRLALPSTREAHHGRLHTWIFCQKRFEVLNKRVLGIDAVEPIGNAAELGIKTVVGEIEIAYPPLTHP